MGGLVAASSLAARGFDVTVLERAACVGGKIRQVDVGGHCVDSGPTVLTMAEIFEEIFDDAGAALNDYINLKPLDTLARHYWGENECLDLFLDKQKTADAISQFSNPAEAKRYLKFCEHSKNVFDTLESTFIRAHRPNPLSLVYRNGLMNASNLRYLKPFSSYWSTLHTYFKDKRLQQLFGRYATYCGSSPFHSPATLSLIAHVEQKGVWLVEGGILKLAEAIQKIATLHGAKFLFQKNVSEINWKSGKITSVTCNTGEQFECDWIIYNGDTAALYSGKFGTETKTSPPYSKNMRSLSAITWSAVVDKSSSLLDCHNVFFSSDYKREFEDIFTQQHPPNDPTIYIHAPDRYRQGSQSSSSLERLLILINAPPNGDKVLYQPDNIERYCEKTFNRLRKCGLNIQINETNSIVTTPNEFESLFPNTGGALYGQATHGWKASFSRLGARSKFPNLYLAGGSVHPGAGVPMAAISGLLAAQRLLQDSGSTAI